MDKQRRFDISACGRLKNVAKAVIDFCRTRLATLGGFFIACQ